MEQFDCIDPTSGQRVNIIIHDIVHSGNRWDDCQQVSLEFADRRQFKAQFWRDPQQRGRHWVEERGMVIVHDLTNEWVITTVETILANKIVEAAFEAINISG